MSSVTGDGESRCCCIKVSLVDASFTAPAVSCEETAGLTDGLSGGVGSSIINESPRDLGAMDESENGKDIDGGAERAMEAPVNKID